MLSVEKCHKTNFAFGVLLFYHYFLGILLFSVSQLCHCSERSRADKSSDLYHFLSNLCLQGQTTDDPNDRDYDRKGLEIPGEFGSKKP